MKTDMTTIGIESVDIGSQSEYTDKDGDYMAGPLTIKTTQVPDSMGDPYFVARRLEKACGVKSGGTDHVVHSDDGLTIRVWTRADEVEAACLRVADAIKSVNNDVDDPERRAAEQVGRARYAELKDTATNALRDLMVE